MQNEEVNLLKNGYSEHLETINGVKFTPREVDIIALTVSGRSSKKIATLLSISSRTVENHIRNIMTKLECNSRENIVEFIERSEAFLATKKHYLYLLVQAAFKKALQEISVLVTKKAPSCLIIYWREYKDQEFLIHWLEKHLKFAGIKVSLEARESYQSLTHLMCTIELQQENHIIYSVPELLMERFRKDDINKSLETALFVERAKKNLPIFLLQGKQSSRDIPESIRGCGYISLERKENYHSLVFELIKRTLPSISFEKILAEYNQQYKRLSAFFEKDLSRTEDLRLLQKTWKNYSLVNILKKWRILLITGCVFCLSTIFILLLTYNRNINQENKTQAKLLVRSDLPIPAEATLLQRRQLLAQIEKKLQHQQGVQIIALVGSGGAGKTILARQYARSQKSSVIWEINAETKESLINSFENLAYVLSRTEEEKKILRGLQNIKNLQEREDKLILFVKDKLRSYPNWLLIYDNVEKFTNIQRYFPYDPLVSGQGKIIITTTDNNIENNSYVSHSIQIGELNNNEKLNLFTKIMHSGNNHQLTRVYTKQLQTFLEKIPPFPLDVSTAAYYLKATNVSFARYLDHLSHYHKDFTTTQESILKEASDYTKTRYSIIILSLKRLINTHKDFGELLLLASLLDSQNIPKALLDAYKNSVVVDSFIYHLNKYSFITNDASTHSFPTFSIHRSTQEVILTYLTKILALEKNNEVLCLIANVLENYVIDGVGKEDFSKMKLLVTHCETFLNHNNLVTEAIKYPISGALGCSYYYLRYYTRAKKLLEESLTNLNQYCHEDYNRNARLLMYLGNVYRANGHFEKAKTLLEQSLILYKKYSENYVGAARALGYLGIVYESLGNYEKAKDLLEQSLVLHKKYSENHIGHAWVLAHLGSTYKTLGEYKKAKILFEQSLIIYKQYAEDYVGVAWVLGFLGDIYRSLGDCQKAINLLEQSLTIYRKHFSEDHIYVALPLSYMGNVYKEMGNYKKAQNLFKQSLVIHEKHYGKNHMETAQILGDLGQIYLLEGHLELAETFINKALGIFQHHKRPESYTCLECLADLYLKKSIQATNKENKQQSQKFKEQALNYSKQALEIVKTNFPNNSPHITRIQFKLKNVNELDAGFQTQ